MTATRSDKSATRQLDFAEGLDQGFLGNARSPDCLAELGVGALRVSPRAKKWMSAHGIANLGALLRARGDKTISRDCLDAQVRNEIQEELKHYCKGDKYIYIFGINFIDKGLERVLSARNLRNSPLSRLEISPNLRAYLEKKGIENVGDLLLQPELPWRHPRRLGNLPVDEILVALAMFMARVRR